MLEDLGDANIIRVKFDEKIEIMQSWNRELSEVVATKYNGLMLIPNRKSAYKIKIGGKAFISKPRLNAESIANYYEKFQQVKIVAVNILPINIEVMVEAETGKEVEIFENDFVPKNLLMVPDESNIAKILIREPDGRHNNYLVLIKIEDKDIREVFQVFFEKKDYQVKSLYQEKENNGNSDNPLLEITMNGNMCTEEVKESIMAPFYAYFNLSKAEA